MTSEEIITSLGACMVRAERAHPGMESTNDFYWHTREKCVEIAQEHGIPISKLIGIMTKLELEYYLGSMKDKLDGLTDPFWNQVQHPLLLCKDVLED